MPQNHAASVRIAESAVKPLREFLKENIGKTKKERENRYAVIHLTPEADNMQVRIVEAEKYGEPKDVTVAYFDCEPPTHYIQQAYNAQLFYYSVQEDFNGGIYFSRENGPAIFKGEQRTSMLMPRDPGYGFKPYISTENPENK